MRAVDRAVRFARAFLKDPLAHWPFVDIARWMFGNTAGAKQNLYGGLQLLYHRLLGHAGGKPATDPETKSGVADLRRNGFLKVKQPLLNDEVIGKIQRKFAAKIKKENALNGGKYMVSYNSDEILREIPEVFEIVKNNRVREILRVYFGGGFHVHEIAYRRTLHVPKEITEQGEVYSDFWHCDSSPTSELALFVNLIDVTREQGPTMLIDKPTTRRFVRKFYRGRRDTGTVKALGEAIERDGHARTFIGAAGSMIFVQTTKCLHRASIPADGQQRDWLSFRFFPKRGSIVDNCVIDNAITRYTHAAAH